MTATYSFTIAGPLPVGWPVLKSVLSAIGDELGLLLGTLLTRTRAAHAIGETTLLVESAYGFPTTGILVVEGEPAVVTYSGVDLTPGAQRFTGCSALVAAHGEGEEIVDYSRTYSRIDQLRRATQVAYAEGSDLSRVARRHNVSRPRALTASDTTFRALVQLIAYMPRNNVYALEQVLTVLFPGGGWTVYESLIEHPAKIFITLPDALGTSPRGRAFLGAREDLTSGSTTAITCTEEPVSVTSVRLQPVQTDVGMTVLPSAATPAWTYQAESAGLEADYFSVGGGLLAQTVVLGGGTDSGRYEIARPDIGQEMNRFEIGWRPDVLAVVGGRPWYLCIRDGTYEYALVWSTTDVILGKSDGSLIAGAVSADLATGWHQMRLERIGDTIYGTVGRTRVLSAPVTSFAASADKLVTFGYFDNAAAQDWTVSWDNLQLYIRNTRNYWNLRGTVGAFTLGSDILTDAGNPFVAGDVGRRIWTPSANPENDSVWEVKAVPAAGQAQLDGVERDDGILDVLSPTTFVSKNARFSKNSVGKDIKVISGANIGDHSITAWNSPWSVECAASVFVTQDDVKWKFSPDLFVTEANVPWEIVDAGTVAGAGLTLRGGSALPFAASDVTVEYTTVESGQVMQNESVENDPVDTYWPFYLYGPERWIEDLLNEIKMAGVILDFNRVY